MATTSPVHDMLARRGLARCQRCQRIVLSTRLSATVCADRVDCDSARSVANGYAKKAGWRR